MLTSVVPIDTANSIKTEYAKRSDLDFNKRSILGVVFYTLAWPVLFLATGFHHEAPLFCWIMALNFLLISVARCILSRVSQKKYAQSPKTWRFAYITTILSHALLWSFLCFVSNYDPTFQELQVSVSILTAGIASASVSALSSKYTLFCGSLSRCK